MIQDRFLPRVWTDEGYYYPVFSELGITYENSNLPFNAETMRTLSWAFGWHFEDNVDDGLVYNHILEMPTGLRDKNGKLIYEGDIIREISKKEPEWEEYIKEVKWWQDGFHLADEYYFDYEIIGNIHENKELIND